MAQVPYGEGVPQVSADTRVPDDYQHIQANPEQFGALIGQGEQKLGQGGVQAAENIFDIAEFRGKINKDDQTNHYITSQNAILYGDPTKPKTGPDGNPVVGPDGKPMPDTGYFGLDGRSASDQREATLKALETARQAGRKNLNSPYEQLAYDTETRRLYADAVQKISSHADTQWKGWAGGVNDKGAELALNGFTTSLASNDAEGMANHAKDFINFRVQNAQMKYGNDPTITSETITQAKRDLLKAQVLAVEVSDPARAKSILEKNREIAGPAYPELAEHLKTRVDQQVGRTGGSALFAAANQSATAQFAAGQPPVEGAKTLLRSFEGFKPQAYWDVNHWRVGYGSDTITKADGSVVPVTQDTQVTQEDAERDLQRRAADATHKVQTQIGPQVWNTMTPQAQAALTSVAYNYGVLPASVVQAAQSGNPSQLSNAVMTLGNDNGGINAGRRQAEAGIIAGRNTYAIKGDAFRAAIESKQFDNEEQRAIALHTISELANAQEVAYNQSTRARTEAINTTVGQYTTRFWNMLHTPNPDWVKFMGEINSDPALADAGQAKDGLMERVIKRSGEEQSLAFGPGYLSVKDRILSDPGTPGHIGDITDIYRLPLGQLTAQGEHELIGIMGAVKKSPDEYGIQKTRGSLENYAKSIMAREQIVPGIGTISTNKKGQEIFDSQFIPQFNAAYSNWIKDDKNPNEFLTKKNVDDMMDRIYPRAQRNVDNMQAVGETGAQTGVNQPLPQPPDGVDQKLWTGLISQPPLMATGQIATPQQYGQAVKMLSDNPTPEMQAKFDKWFGQPNHGAKEILGMLANKAAAAGQLQDEAAGWGPARDITTGSIHDTAGPGPAGMLRNLFPPVPAPVKEFFQHEAAH